MAKRVYLRISQRKAALFIVILVGICLICLIAGQIWMARQSERETVDSIHSFITLSEALTDGSVEQAIRLGQMLALDLDVSKFIYQGPIEAGSSDIQAMIDTLWKLPTSRNVNPIIADIFIYSKASGYLLNSSNLFFDIDRMYSLFQFEGLSSLQFRSSYLNTRSSGFFPSTTVVIDGRQMRVIPYVQTFPLSNQSANTGKVMILLNESLISHQLGAIGEGGNGWYCVADSMNRVITTSNPAYARSEVISSLEDGPHRKVSIEGEKFFVSVISSTNTGLRYICAIGENDFKARLAPIFFSMTLGATAMLAVSFILGIMEYSSSQRNWNRLNSLLGNSRANSSYEQIADTIVSILEDERKADRQKRGQLPFKYETVFRRYIHGRPQSDAELETLFKEIHGKSLETGDIYRLMKVMIHEKEVSMNIDDLDFFRLAADKEANESFQGMCYIFIDLSFNAWILAWSGSDAVLNRCIRLFQDRMEKIIPFDISLAVSGPKSDFRGLRQASAECSAVVEWINDSSSKTARVDYEELAGRLDVPLYTKEMERNLILAVSSGDPKSTMEVLDAIYDQNFVKRSLNHQNLEALRSQLHVTAIQYRLKRGCQDLPDRFTSFQSARSFFLGEAGQTILSRNEIEQNTRMSIIAYIDDNYSNPTLNLSVAASDLQMKENYLYHFMSTRMGQTFSSYLEEYRLDKARQMLVEDLDSAINAIALSCGYTNPQTFRRAFSKRFGQLPSDFRNTIAVSDVR